MKAVVVSPSEEGQDELMHKLRKHKITTVATTATRGGGLVMAAMTEADLMVVDPATDDAPALDTIFELTPRELEVLTLMTRGMTDVAIGGALHISIHTVHNYVSSCREKMGVRGRHSRLRAAVMAVQVGLVR